LPSPSWTSGPGRSSGSTICREQKMATAEYDTELSSTLNPNSERCLDIIESTTSEDTKSNLDIYLD
jgi:hypothetical protein